MSHTLQTAIAFPIVFAGIVALLSWGPILYTQSVDAAELHVYAIQLSLHDRHIYCVEPLVLDSGTYEVVCTSPERMHAVIRAIQDSITIFKEGVFST